MKLIDKDALVAEIGKYLKIVRKRLERNNSYNEKECIAWERDKALYDSYNRILSFIDTLEVKEVDLKKEATIKGYVARDLDRTLRFCYYKPRRENEIEKTWWGSCDADFDIYNDTLDSLFKDLTWDNEPVEVELTIKRL